MLRLDSDVQYVKGVGPRRASLLASRGIRTVSDLLLHIPKSYQDRASFVPLLSLRIGQDAAGVRGNTVPTGGFTARDLGRQASGGQAGAKVILDEINILRHGGSQGTAAAGNEGGVPVHAGV